MTPVAAQQVEWWEADEVLIHSAQVGMLKYTLDELAVEELVLRNRSFATLLLWAVPKGRRSLT